MLPFRLPKLGLLLSLLLPVAVQATVTDLMLFEGGEADSGAYNGGAASPATDSAGTLSYPLNYNGTPTWDFTNVAPAANLALGPSTSSYHFDGTSYFSTNPPNSAPLDNWGLEAWVNLSNVSGGNLQVIFGYGNGGNGLFLAEQSSEWTAFEGGVGFASMAAASSNQWTELALVDVDNSVQMYVNGTLVGVAGTPAQGNQVISMGSDFAGDFVTGNIDDARFFTFSEGAFNATTDLNYVSAVPEPRTWALLAGIAALVLAFGFRSRFRALVPSRSL